MTNSQEQLSRLRSLRLPWAVERNAIEPEFLVILDKMKTDSDRRKIINDCLFLCDECPTVSRFKDIARDVWKWAEWSRNRNREKILT